MKLMGLGLNLPVADLRIPFDPNARHGFLSPYRAKLGVPGKPDNYLNGFGKVGARKLRIPWRQNETIYFRCHGAISLPDQLPDNAPVTQDIRRLYLDDGPTARFDFSVFTNPQKTNKSKGVPNDWILNFWQSNLKFYEKRGHYKTVSFVEALPNIISKFSKYSASRDYSRFDLIKPLSPQIIMIIQADQKDFTQYISTSLKAINKEHTLFVATEYQQLPGIKLQIPITFIIYHPIKFKSKDDSRFEQLRMARALCAWLHTDIQVLEELLSTVCQNPIFLSQLNSNIIELADGISNLSKACIEHDLQINLADVVPGYVISRIQNCIEKSPFNDIEKQRISFVLQSNFKHKHAKPTRSLDDLINKGIKIYKDYLDGKITPQRYADSDFSKSAQEKAFRIYNLMPPTFKSAKPIFVSVGGADAAELFELMKITSSSAGVLLEYADKSTDSARNQAKSKNVRLEIVTGDAMDKIDEAMNRAIELQISTRGGPIIVTMMAVLHELPSRSKKFNLLTFLSKLNKADMIIGREPVEPTNWSEYVLLEGKFMAKRFATFSNQIVSGHFLKATPKLKTEPSKFTVDVIDEHKVKGHRAIIIEALTKAFYVEDLIYELEERVTTFEPDDIMKTIKECFGKNYLIDYDRITSDSITKYWGMHSLITKDAELPFKLLGKPESHCLYWAIKDL